ncbi:MAG: ECF transporter S component, partial [Pseudoflavonifractor sp.]
MLVELAAYGLLTGFGMGLFRTKHRFLDLYLSMLTAMVGGRILAGAAKALIFAPGSLSMAAWVTGYFVTALPGIVLQLLLVPAMVYALEKARLIPARYPR